jgi:hypothetical protein
MPILYKEIPRYAFAKQRARHRVALPQATLEYRRGGYYVASGDREFLILNQNPVCLKRFLGKPVAVHGRTTENLAPWHRLYFLVIDRINGMSYDGRVGPWAMRDPTDEEIRYWNRNHRLPPATQKFMEYLAMPVQASDFSFSDDYPAAGNLLAANPGTAECTMDLNNRLTDIQRQLTVIEQRGARQPYQGLYSTHPDKWDATDWSMYMDLQGGG